MLEKLIGFAERVGGVLPGVTRANRVSPALSSQWERELGVGQSWMPLSYGEYYPRSALVYSAIKIRQDAVARVPLRVYRGEARGPGPGVRGVPTGPDVEALGASHPVQRLLETRRTHSGRGETCGGLQRRIWACGAPPSGAWSVTRRVVWRRYGR